MGEGVLSNALQRQLRRTVTECRSKYLYICVSRTIELTMRFLRLGLSKLLMKCHGAPTAIPSNS
jgi:hypothetical protein